ncbi:MAG: hypothetical protein U0132_02700 [Gemmatimonadaceae bacterium]
MRTQRKSAEHPRRQHTMDGVRAAVISVMAARASRARGHTMTRMHPHSGVPNASTSAQGPSGFALFAALIAVVLVSAFIAMAWTITMREFRASIVGASAVRAMEAAEYASTAPLESWIPGDALTMPIAATQGPASRVLAGGATATWRMQRLTSSTFLTLGEGLDGETERRTSLLLRLSRPDFDTSATVTVGDSVWVHTGAMVSGFDAIPPGWGGSGLACTLHPAQAATASPDSTRVCDGTCGAPAGVGVVGQPARLTDTTASDSARYTIFGAETWSTLAARATVRLSAGVVVTPLPVTTGARCDRTVSSNWGDLTRATVCADYFPVIYAAGDVTMHGGSGQGILLAEGDVTLESGATFAGVIVSRDDVRSAIGGAHVFGRVLAQDRDVSDGRHPDLATGGLVERSSCAESRAVEGSAPLRRVTSRSWNPLYR